jgi:hypothetical protein
MPETFSATDLDLNQHSMENLSWRLVTLMQGRSGGKSGCLKYMWFYDAHLHFDGYIRKLNVRYWTSWNQRISVTNHPEKMWCLLSRVGRFDSMFLRVQPLLMSASACWVMNLPSSWSDMAFQLIQPGLNKMALALTSTMPYFAFFLTFSSPIKLVSCVIWGRIFMTTKLIKLKPLWLFSMDLLEWSDFFRHIRTQFRNCYPIRDWSCFYSSTNRDPEQFCYSFA